VTVHFVGPSVYRFGEFELDPAMRELRRRGVAVDLPTKAFACALYLIEHRNRAVDRDELMVAVWGHVHLTESVLGQAIRHARQALSDSGEDQRVIRTVRGFGYRWAAKVDPSGDSTPAARPAPASVRPRTTSRPRRIALLWSLGALGILIAVAGLVMPRHENLPPTPTENALEPRGADSIAMLLPVAGPSGPDHAWIRLGVMDFIADRLRAAGQPMVPTDTVVMLLRDSSASPDPNALLRLTASTRARIVLEAQAEQRGDMWRISLRSLGDTRPSLAAIGEGEDVLMAARNASDRLAIALGRMPAIEPDEALALTSLMQRINAAILAQRPDMAQQLVQSSTPELRAVPEIRYQLGRITFYNHDRAGAQAMFEALLKDVPGDRDPLLRARVLNGLAAVYEVNGNLERAESTYEDAARLLEHREAPDTLEALGNIWTNLGNVARERRDLALARERLARARRFFEGTGDAGRLAELELDMGVLEATAENYTEALHRFESAAALHAAIQDVGGELMSLCYLVEVQLELMNPGAAASAEPRIRQLLSAATQPSFLVRAKLSLSHLLYATGRDAAGDALLNEVLAPTDSDPGAILRTEALMTRAERSASRGESSAAAESAREVIRLLASDSEGSGSVLHGNAWRILIHADIARGDVEAAAKAVAAMTRWSRTDPTPSTRIYAALVQADLAAAEGRRGDADAAYEEALAFAVESHIPRRLLQAVQDYVGWLLEERGRGLRDDRMLPVAERIAEYADGDYEAALVELRVYRALGPSTAWRCALRRARSLAGERRIPPELEPDP
jgi:DNA-binding winged helix-turn-helix (wHTH) protein/tetratricopeptide (TPR) repeat protein